MKTKYTGLLKLIGAIALIVLLFTSVKVSYHDIIKVLSGLRWTYLVLSMPGVILVLLFKSIRWNILLKQTGIEFTLFKSFSAYMSAYSIGILTPGRVGEFVKVYNVRKDKNVGFLEALKSVLADRLFDLICLVMLGLSSFLSIYFKLELYQGIIIYFLFQIIGIMLSVTGYLGLKFIISRFRILQKPFVFLLKDCFALLFKQKSIVTWGLTWIAYLTYFVFLRFLLLAFGVEVNFIGIMNAMSLLSLVLLIPLTLAGFGQREISLVYLLGLYGVSTEISIAFSLMQFTLFFLWGGLVGLVFFFSNPIPFRIIINDAKQLKKFFKTKSASA